jgi:two-component system chemotaxis response regulator CheY
MDVFLVDDRAPMRRLLRSLVEELGHRVVGEAANGRQACFDVAATVPDVVVMDAHMPVMGGVEATRVLTRIMPSARVIGCAPAGADGLDGDFLEAGACAYVVKDDVAALVAALEDEARRLAG